MSYYNRHTLTHPIIWHACGLVPHNSGDYVTGLERKPQDSRNTMWPEIRVWALVEKIAPDPDIRILVPNTKATSLIERQLYENGQPYGVVGKCPECRDKAWSHIKKMEVLLRAVRPPESPTWPQWTLSTFVAQVACRYLKRLFAASRCFSVPTT